MNVELSTTIVAIDGRTCARESVAHIRFSVKNRLDFACGTRAHSLVTRFFSHPRIIAAVLWGI